MYGTTTSNELYSSEERTGGAQLVDQWLPTGTMTGNRVQPGDVERTHGPLVTVVITTYDRPSYLSRAVTTVAEQSYENVELVVVDDHSPTPASETLGDTASWDVDLTVIRHEVNRGPNAARNTGVEAANGTYVAFLDDDDRWEPEKLAQQVACFERDGAELGLVSTGWKRLGESGVEDVWLPPEVDNTTEALLCRNVVGTLSAVMARTDIARETPFDERFPLWADLEWYVSMSTKCTFGRIPEPLVVHEFDTHNRITNDPTKLFEGSELFLEKYQPLAAERGTLMERKMRGWAAYRVGESLMRMGRYDSARWYLLNAIRWYPLEPSFYVYAGAVLGGRRTHSAARFVRDLVQSIR